MVERKVFLILVGLCDDCMLWFIIIEFFNVYKNVFVRVFGVEFEVISVVC